MVHTTRSRFNQFWQQLTVKGFSLIEKSKDHNERIEILALVFFSLNISFKAWGIVWAARIPSVLALMEQVNDSPGTDSGGLVFCSTGISAIPIHEIEHVSRD